MKNRIYHYRKLLIIIPLCLLTLAGTYFFFHGKTPLVAELPLPTEAPIPTVPDKVRSIIEEIGQVTTLPANEIPNVATVTDVEKLQDQLFFAKAKKGDKVLIYSIAREAFLYRPATKEIIESGPVEVVSETDNEASMSAETASDSGQPVLKIRY